MIPVSGFGLAQRVTNGRFRKSVVLVGAVAVAALAVLSLAPRVELRLSGQKPARQFLASVGASSSPAPRGSLPNENSPLGTNLNGVTYYTSEWPFVDVMKIAGGPDENDRHGDVNFPWLAQQVEGGPNDTGKRLRLKNGYPASLASGQAAAVLIYHDVAGHYPGGDYSVFFDGNGTLEFGGDATIVRKESDRLIVRVEPSNEGIVLRIIATDRRDPLRNIRIIMPGFAETYETEPFHPLFLKRMEKYRVLRFMDWMATNNSTQRRWEDRPKPTDSTQASPKGVALEHLIDLANTLHADGWFSLPAEANDAYVRQFATLVRDRLQPDRRVYIEYSNEVWNDLFSAAAYARKRGRALRLSRDPDVAQSRFYAQRSVEIFTIFEQVFGSRERLVRVIGTQVANIDVAKEILEWNETFAHADALAVAPYFTMDPSTVPDPLGMSDAELFAALRADITGLTRGVQEHVDYARSRGLPVFAYEGGSDLTANPYADADAVTKRFAALSRHPEMKDVYLEYLTAWESAGAQLFNQFVNVGSWSKYGTWGALEYQDQDPATSPKYQALMEFICLRTPCPLSP